MCTAPLNNPRLGVWIDNPEKVVKLSFYHQHKDIVRLINMNFVIRVYKFVDGKKIKTLVGGGQITKYMSEETALQQFDKCLNGHRDKYVWWDRNVLRIEFIAK